ncbi:MAG: hypothetical protein AAF519_10225 [Bacteroidota bacterium]
MNSIEYSPDGKHFVNCSMDKVIKIWDSHTFKLLKVVDKARHAGHENSINKLLMPSCRHLLLSASDDRAISIWYTQFT